MYFSFMSNTLSFFKKLPCRSDFEAWISVQFITDNFTDGADT